jgi:hypothetical protein
MTDALDTFDTAVLQGLGAPVNANTLAALRTWARYEDGASLSGNGAIARNNPLNTESQAPGAWNAVGAVKGYPNFNTGVQATLNTLTNGRYAAIVAALQKGTPLSGWDNPAITSEINTWGTHDFASALGGGSTVTALPTTGGASSSSSAPPAAGSGQPVLTLTGLGTGLQSGVAAGTTDAWTWLKSKALSFAVAGVVLAIVFSPKEEPAS